MKSTNNHNTFRMFKGFIKDHVFQFSEEKNVQAEKEQY